MSNGFIAPGYEIEAEAELRALTQQVFELEAITKGTYILEEEDLPESLKELLHGRAFVVDMEETTAITKNDAITYYIAADKAQGLIVPARSLSIDDDGAHDIYYRWTDNGERWTNWITLEEFETHSYAADEKSRFAEVQVYASVSGTRISLRATR